MSQTTCMRYAVFTKDGCVESLCYTFKEATTLACNVYKRVTGSVTVVRYDRSKASKYSEILFVYVDGKRVGGKE